jgi:photosystem II stability/assembly factor-like uncharacterized protein
MAKAGLLFVGTDDGAVLFSNPNNIGRWLRIGQPFRGQAVRALWPLPDNPLVVFAAVAGMGLQRSDDGGQSWAAAFDGDVSAIVGDRGAPELVYFSTAAGLVYRSEDAGAGWARCPQGGWQPSQEARLSVAPSDAMSVYLGLGDGSVWASSDGGSSWRALGDRLPAPVVGLAGPLRAGGGVYAVAGGALYHSDGDASWRRMATPSAALALAALAGKEPVLLLGQASGVWRSDDAGATWTAAEAEAGWDGDIGVVVPVGYHVDTAFAGSAAGRLYTSTDRGRSWQLIKQDLASIHSIAAARLV